jgi:oligopeptide transport system substrate-binding protein
MKASRTAHPSREVGGVKSRLNASLGLVLALGLVAAACQPAQQAPERATGGSIRVEISEPGSFDPPNVETSEDSAVARFLFEGLVTYDEETAETKPGVATEWEPSADSTVWTFTLREDAVFSNSEAITAETFVRSWTRTTAKETASEVGYHLAGVQGYKEHFEDGAPDLPGVKAKDKFTLEVTLSAPDPEFAIKAGHSPFWPVPSEATIQAQKPSFGEFPIGNGPFKMKEAWKHNQSITIVRNDDYVGGRSKPFLDEVVYVVLPDFDTAYLEWQAGNLDFLRVTPAKTTEAKAQGEKFINDPTAIFDYLNFLTNKPLTSDKRVRQAISLSIDRQAIIDSVFAGNRSLAKSILPPVMPGFRKEGPCKYCTYDPTRAKQLLAEAGVAPGTRFVLSLNTGAGHEAWIQAVADQIKTNLGLEAEVVGKTPFSEYLKYLESPEGAHVGRLGWGMDYPTPWNFLFPIFHSDSADNHSFYNNPEFESLLASAGTKPKVEDRIKIYQQAEDIVLEDMVIAPMWNRTTNRLGNTDKFGGLGLNPFDDFNAMTAFLKTSPSP